MDLRIGTELVGHRIEGILGRGGMGVVYKAEHIGLGRKVALKVLTPGLAGNEAFRERFIRESHVLAAMEHLNIIPIYEAGEANGILYISMRYVDGPDLSVLIEQEGRLEPQRTFAIGSQVADALDAAHLGGVIHRDVKPANILIASGLSTGATEHCYLCDFGLIKHFDSEYDLTLTGQFVGSIPYVAPEQIEGRPQDGRADVYALACVLFQCLTGVVPFDRPNDVAVVYAHLQDPPPSLSALRPNLPAALDPVFARAMAKSREERFATCTDLVEAARMALRAPARMRQPVLGGTGLAVPTAQADALTELRPPRRAPPSVSPRPTLDPVTRVLPPSAGATRRASVASGPRTGRRILVLLLAVAGLAAVLGWALARSAGSQMVTGQAAPSAPICAGGWTQPARGTPLRQVPLDTIRRVMGVSGTFSVQDMRYFLESDSGRRWWYVKAAMVDDSSFRARWLVEQGTSGLLGVAAVAPYDTSGFRSPDWLAFDGREPVTVYPGLPGRWTGSPRDFVAGRGNEGLPAEARGCLEGT
jgi:Protein kinase domain